MRPGAEEHLIQGLAAEILRQSDSDRGPQELHSYTLECAAADTGLTAADLSETAAELARAGNVGIVWALGSWVIGSARELSPSCGKSYAGLAQRTSLPSRQ